MHPSFSLHVIRVYSKTIHNYLPSPLDPLEVPRSVDLLCKWLLTRKSSDLIPDVLTEFHLRSFNPHWIWQVLCQNVLSQDGVTVSVLKLGTLDNSITSLHRGIFIKIKNMSLIHLTFFFIDYKDFYYSGFFPSEDLHTSQNISCSFDKLYNYEFFKTVFVRYFLHSWSVWVDTFLYLTSFCQYYLKSMENKIFSSFITSLQNTWAKLKICYFFFVLPCVYGRACRLVSSQ